MPFIPDAHPLLQGDVHTGIVDDAEITVGRSGKTDKLGDRLSVKKDTRSMFFKEVYLQVHTMQQIHLKPEIGLVRSLPGKIDPIVLDINTAVSSPAGAE